jgi:hypothetical protein
MKQWNNTVRTPGSKKDDEKWEDNVQMLEPEAYSQGTPLLVRIFGGIFISGRHWLTSKNNKNFPLGCPTFNPHTEANDLMFCPQCWTAFTAGQMDRPYHSSEFLVYDDRGQLIDDPQLWTPRNAGETATCPFHPGIILQPLACELCDINYELYKANIEFSARRVGRVNPFYYFNVLVRQYQQEGAPNPLRVFGIPGKVMDQVNAVASFNGGVHPSDPDMGCDFWILYNKDSKVWSINKGDQVPLTEEERALVPWRIDQEFRAASAQQINQAVSVHGLRRDLDGDSGATSGAPAPAPRPAPKAAPAPAPAPKPAASAPAPTPTTPQAAPQETAPPEAAAPEAEAPVAEEPSSAVDTEAPAGDLPECHGKWGSEQGPKCMRCAHRATCVEKFNGTA